jgi:hypothetical protein
MDDGAHEFQPTMGKGNAKSNGEIRALLSCSCQDTNQLRMLRTACPCTVTLPPTPCSFVS